MNPSISVIIPAYNEEGNIVAAIESVIYALEGVSSDYEIIVIDDGSKDKTAPLARGKSAVNPSIRVVSNEGNQGYGYTFRRGIKLATKTYFTAFQGDNDMSRESFRELIGSLEKAQVVTSHMENKKSRSFLRRFLSQSFVRVMNILFRLRLKYYTGMFICESRLVKSVALKSDGLVIVAECLVRLIKAGSSYTSIAFKHVQRQTGESKALTLKNIFSTLKIIFILVSDIYCKQSALDNPVLTTKKLPQEHTAGV